MTLGDRAFNIISKMLITVAALALATCAFLAIRWHQISTDPTEQAERSATKIARGIAAGLDAKTTGSINGTVEKFGGSVVHVVRRSDTTYVIVSVNAAAGGVFETQVDHCYEYRVPKRPGNRKVTYKQIADDRCLEPAPTATTVHS